MILPSKHLPQDRALLTVGGHVLTFLARPKTVSALWEELNRHEEGLTATTPRRITYDWFLLLIFCMPLGPSNSTAAWWHGGQLDSPYFQHTAHIQESR